MNKELKKLYIYVLYYKWPIKQVTNLNNYKYCITLEGGDYNFNIYLTEVKN